MGSAKVKQVERIYNYMDENGSITSKDAMNKLGVYRLASRIHDMKKLGIGVIKEMESGTNMFGEKVTYARYRLEETK